jgi:hypothetical protein
MFRFTFKSQNVFQNLHFFALSEFLSLNYQNGLIAARFFENFDYFSNKPLKNYGIFHDQLVLEDVCFIMNFYTCSVIRTKAFHLLHFRNEEKECV